MALPKEITIRNATYHDHKKVLSVIPEWWGGRDLRSSLPKLLLIHFAPTSFIAEQGGSLAGFLIGFLSQSFPEEAYIHFAGVRPDLRNMGLGRELYDTFFQTVRSRGRTVVRCCTAPENKVSIGFHQCMGFKIEPGDTRVDGIPVTTGYLGETDEKVIFKCTL